MQLFYWSGAYPHKRVSESPSTPGEVTGASWPTAAVRVFKVSPTPLH